MGLKIPITVYDRKRGDDINQVDGSRVRKGTYYFTFAPLPNLFGDDLELEIDQTFDNFGYTAWIKKARYNPDDHSVTIDIEVLSIPENTGGPSTTALPLVAIVGGIAAIVGGVLLVTILTKVQHIFELPVFYLVAGGAVLYAIPPVMKAFRSGGS